jgi:ABC-type transport system involved in multi-copper enzyme maturation permease subunit
MIASLRAELVKVLRRRVLVITAIATAVIAIGSAAVVLTSAEPAGRPATGRGVTAATLSDAGGGTDVFMTAISFVGSLLFVVFVGVVAIEFSRGTFRTMLLHQPRRLRLLAGKMAGLLSFAAVVLASAEVVAWAAALLIAPSQSVDVAGWTTLDALGQAVADYGSVLFWVTGYALLGMTVAVLARSVPVALAVGIAWVGPFEHLLQDAWSPAQRIFPGLLLEAFAAGGTTGVSAGRAVATVSLYVAAAAAVAATVFARRDVTA